MNIYRKIRLVIYICICLSVQQSFARTGIDVAYAKGTNHVKAYRVGFQHAWSNKEYTPNKRRLTGYWDLAFSKMNSPYNNLQAYSASAVLRVPYRAIFNWFLDVGFGLAYLSETEISHRNLGSHWLFEDRVGVGILLGARHQYEVGYRFMHYSNAYLAKSNQGLNLNFLVIGYWF